MIKSYCPDFSLSWILTILIVSCVIESTKSWTTQDYGKYKKTKSVALVLNGRPQSPEDFPWQAALFVLTSTPPSYTYICGGTLLDEYHVLTAAHCMFSDSKVTFSPSDLEIILAPTSGIYFENNGPNTQKIRVSEIIYYKEGKDSDGYLAQDDIAILRLVTSANTRSGFIRPARLPSGNEDFDRGMVVQVNGYGTTSETTLTASKQFYGLQADVNSPDCKESSQMDSRMQFCATPTNAYKQSTPCKGDSGGGAFKQEPNDYWSIQGIVSNGLQGLVPSNCFYVSVFTKVQFYVSWIVSVTRKGPPVHSNPTVDSTATTTTTTTAITPIAPRSPLPLPDIYISKCHQEANQAAVDLHNYYRRRHHSPLLEYDYNVALRAQNYADTLVSGNRLLQLDRSVKYGQNTYQLTGIKLPCAEAARKAVTSWYTGISGYSWSAPLSSTFNGMTFTQVVWKASVRIGVGVATHNLRNVVIAFYSPAGNIQSEKYYRDNVQPQ